MSDRPPCGPCDIGENTPCTCDEPWPPIVKPPSAAELEAEGQQTLFTTAQAGKE